MSIQSFKNNNKPNIPISAMYHGSNSIVDEPGIRVQLYTKDFGQGFYITNNKGRAEDSTLKFKNNRINNVYSYHPEKLEGLNVKIFKEIDKEWLDFIAKCRNGEPHSYDMVEGPMADDRLWDYVNGYFAGEWTYQEFMRRARIGRPSHQICLLTQESLECIKFIESYEVIKDER